MIIRLKLNLAIIFACMPLMLGACKSAEPATTESANTEQAADEEKAPSQLCIVRHAEAYRNIKPTPEGLSAEELDTLTANGEDQAGRVAGAVVHPVGLLWTSPTKRTRQTAQLSGLDRAPEIVDDLRMLEGDVSWDERVGQWEAERDPRPDAGESLADGHLRATSLLTRARSELAAGEHAVFVTHGDIASILIGELQGTPLLARPMTHVLGSGESLCLPLGERAN